MEFFSRMLDDRPSCEFPEFFRRSGKGSEPTFATHSPSSSEKSFSLSRFNSEFVSRKSSSYDSGHNMGLGTKNRQRQRQTFASQHLREKICDKLALVEEFVVEIEGARKDCGATHWAHFTDIKDIQQETLKRLELHFENWLNPGTQ
jgi:hypothetical protein